MIRRVVVAHEADAIRESALRVVREAGYEGIGVAEGESARALVLQPPHPAALVVDVGLPVVLGYQLCEEIRARDVPTRVVLVASVYSKTAYKRRPTSLYGADDYVEQHHIPDQLVPKLARLVPPPRPVVPRDVHDPFALSPAEKRELEQIRGAGEGRLLFERASRDEALDRARRLARLIVADVVLYNGVAVEAGIAGGDLAARLGADLQAGRELLANRLPADLAAAEDFIATALAEFVASRGTQKP